MKLNTETQTLLTPAENKAEWLSVYIASAISLSGTVQYTLYFSSLWPYLQVMDKSVTETFYGFIVSIFSAGQIIAAPLIGYWSNRIRQVRLPIIVGIMIMLVGNFLYLGLGLVKHPGKLLLVARFLMGVGSAHIVLLRSFAAVAMPEKHRARAISLITCGQAIGITLGPIVQLLFTYIDYPGIHLYKGIWLNLYTAPAFISLITSTSSACLMQFFFKENCDGIVNSSSLYEDGTPKLSQIPPYDKTPIIVCLLTRFAYIYINTNLETIGAPYSMMMFVWNESVTVFYTSIAQSAIGVCTLLVYFGLIFLQWDKCINYRLGCLCAMVSLIVFHLITYSWPFLPNHVTIVNRTNIADQSSSAGCNIEEFSWCASLQAVNVWVYFVAYVIMMGFGLPILNIGNTTLFSDVLGPRRQATEQGFLQMSGGVARLFGPLIMSNLYSSHGPMMAWNMEITVIALNLILWLVFYDHIVPLKLTKVDQTYSHNIQAADVTPDIMAPSSGMSSVSTVNSPLCAASFYAISTN